MKIAFTLFLAFASVYAQTFELGQTYNVSNTPSATSDYHSVYSSQYAPGVAWGDNGRILYKRLEQMGGQGYPYVIVSSTENTCGWPVLKGSDPWTAAQRYIVYHTLAQGGNYEIIFQKSTDTGVTWSQMKKISGSASAITPQMAASGDSIFAVWEERPNNNYEIYSAYSYDGGSTWSQPVNVSNTPATSRWVQLHKDDLALYCFWIEQPSYPNGDIFMSKSFDKGASWTAPVNITNINGPILRVSLSPLIYMEDFSVPKSFYLMYDYQVSVNFNEIYMIATDDGGATFSAPVNWTNNSGNSSSPSLVAYWTQTIPGLRRFLYFAWSDNTHSAPGYDNLDVYFKYSMDNGGSWSQTYNLSSNSENSYRPRILSFRPIPLSAPPGVDFLNTVWYDYTTGNAEILSRSAIHNFSNLTPVELLSFSASVNDGRVLLDWSTASELNNAGFDLERKPAGEEDGWVYVAHVKGAGTTTAKQVYQLRDKPPAGEAFLYRLTQVDYDGTRRDIGTAQVNLAAAAESKLMQNSPNPVYQETEIRYRVPVESRVTLTIMDVLGKVVATLEDGIKPAGEYTVRLRGKDFSAGVYFYSLRAGKFSETRKMMFVR